MKTTEGLHGRAYNVIDVLAVAALNILLVFDGVHIAHLMVFNVSTCKNSLSVYKSPYSQTLNQHYNWATV